ncbi:MAG: hypothetical protein KDD42_01020 [Bdellovibrionales bacterium]|nr:hypothetical protein [Bdellovibrionales bacterium]
MHQENIRNLAVAIGSALALVLLSPYFGLYPLGTDPSLDTFYIKEQPSTSLYRKEDFLENEDVESLKDVSQEEDPVPTKDEGSAKDFSSELETIEALLGND